MVDHVEHLASYPAAGACIVCQKLTRWHQCGVWVCGQCEDFFFKQVAIGQKRADYEVENKSRQAPVSYDFKHFTTGITRASSRLFRALENLHTFELSEVLKIFPQLDIGARSFVQTNGTLYTPISQKACSAFAIMLCSAIPALGDLDTVARMHFAAETKFELHMVNEFYMTAASFPEVGDPRLAVMPGLSVNLLDQAEGYWFDGEMAEDEKAAYMNLLRPYLFHYLSMVNEFRIRGLNQFDVCFIMLLTICKYCDGEDELNKTISQFKGRVLAEYSEYLRRRYKEKSYDRLMSILLLYDKVVKFSIDSKNLQAQLEFLRSNGAKFALYPITVRR
ncbi:unnamed protein product [Bursaphelenchus xylophilus]|uniref:(pine wood nematode) hypothetical protein n=1 Tax=Bursaphelenchus xylophilus TaxID=6326 RepID=A0A7I8XPX0_BURXY|nr:unnamed protein product [Bursaphelenchus xylophilus]CAG9126728.1 unnamed protein product [Bursaphelenchus xylophilus]